MNEDQHLWNKNLNDITVGDAVKLNVVVTVGIIGAYAAGWGIATAVVKVKDKVHGFKQNRRDKKMKLVS